MFEEGEQEQLQAMKKRIGQHSTLTHIPNRIQIMQHIYVCVHVFILGSIRIVRLQISANFSSRIEFFQTVSIRSLFIQAYFLRLTRWAFMQMTLTVRKRL